MFNPDPLDLLNVRPARELCDNSRLFMGGRNLIRESVVVDPVLCAMIRAERTVRDDAHNDEPRQPRVYRISRR